MRRPPTVIPKAVTFRRKVTAVLVVATTLLILSVAGLIYPRAFHEQQEGIRRMVTAIAATGALMIDGDAHAAIPPTAAAEAHPNYKELQTRLKKILGTNPGVRYVWTMVPGDRPTRTIFVGDVGGGRPKPGLRYDASKIPGLLKGFRGPTADRSPVKDPWGISISGYAPIRDSSNKVVAVLGVDLYGRQLQMFREKFARYLMLSLLAGVVLAFLLGHFIGRWIARPLDQLVYGMHQLEKGEFYTRVALRTGDEFEEAAEAFNRMTITLRTATDELRESFLQAVEALMFALEAKDPYTRGHSESVTKYATAMARVLGKTQKEVETISRLAKLHDIGKIGIHDEVLLKPGIFTAEERKKIENHPTIGGKILAPLRLPKAELDIIVNHHEREDGSGYPKGLHREEISDLVAIVSVADAFDAMTSNRPHQKAVRPPEAIAELRRAAGSQFRPEAVEALATVLKQLNFI
jgi:putative nucleotidyltransferase with HDIG domain